MDTAFSPWLQAVLQLGALGLLAGILYYLFKIVPTAIKEQTILYRDMLKEFHAISTEQRVAFEERNNKIVKELQALDNSSKNMQQAIIEQTAQLRQVVEQTRIVAEHTVGWRRVCEEFHGTIHKNLDVKKKE